MFEIFRHLSLYEDLYDCLQKQVFEPPNVRMEDREDRQKQMEQEFEDMYMAGTGTIISLFVLMGYPILIV